MDSTQPATIGHNSGALDLSLALDPEQLSADLLADVQPLLIRRDELVAAFARFEAATPDGIPDEEVQARAGDFVRQLTAHLATTEARRTAIKRPVLDAQRLIDGFFKAHLTDVLDAKKRAVLAKITAFLKRQEQEERARRQAEAERLRAEAERLAAAAERTDDAAVMDRALDAEQRAAELATMPTRAPITRSDLGTSVSARKGPIKMRVTDIDKVPRGYLVPNETVLLAVGRSNAEKIDSGIQPVPGIEFYRETLANIR